MSTQNLNQLAQRLKALHVFNTPLILNNVYDASSAKLVAQIPYTLALATSSYAIAATQGLADNDMTLHQNLVGIGNVAAGLRCAGLAGALPLSADLQDGYQNPGETVARAIALGVVGCNIEDSNNFIRPRQLRTMEDAASRIQQVLRAAMDAGVPDFVVNARTDVLCCGGSLEDVLERGKAYLNAGATTVFVWGADRASINKIELQQMAESLGYLAVLRDEFKIDDLLEVQGVKRISVGPKLLKSSLDQLQVEAEAAYPICRYGRHSFRLDGENELGGGRTRTPCGSIE